MSESRLSRLLRPVVPSLFWFISLPGALSAADLPDDHAARMKAGLGAFDAEIRAVLNDHCLKCHGGAKTKGEFDLAVREGLLKGGADGPSVVPFHPEKSRLLKMLRHEEEPYMPENKPRLPDSVIEKIAAWIGNGAPYSAPLVAGRKEERDRSKVTDEDRSWWAFRPLGAPTVPAGTAAHPVDRFLAAKAAGKGPAPEADRRTLVRRATLDLTGLPPTPEEVTEFLEDQKPGAWERLIDRLLARPAYGERWARHWMDVARYGESSGFEQDYDRTGSYHYRDFLIDAFNRDLPFPEFVRLQLAADEYRPGDVRSLAATAFLTLGVFPTQITVNELERVRYEDMDDMLSTTGSAFLGLTVGCARCHDHKFDPIPSRDYYRMLATFTGTVRSEPELDLNPEETARKKAEWQGKLDAATTSVQQRETELRRTLEQFLERDLPSFPAVEGWAVWGAAPQPGTWERKEDGSLSSKAVPASGKLQWEGTLACENVNGFRVEAMSDRDLPSGGAGHAKNGTFEVRTVRVERQNPDGTWTAVNLANAIAGSSGADLLPGANGWKGTAKGGVAAWKFEQAQSGSARWRVQMDAGQGGKAAPGRVRLAFLLGADSKLDAEWMDERVAALLQQKQRPGTAFEAQQHLEGWWFRRDPEYRKRDAARVSLAGAEPKGLTKVLVGSESFPAVRYHTAGGAVETYKETFFLKRGNVGLKDGVATPGFLQALSRAPETRWNWNPPAGATYAGKRRQLAEWILDAESGAGALSARVFVNRLWQHHFGRGIVSSPNDFGKSGVAPTHPELLDWLASEFLKTGGGIKAMHRLLMTSAAYRQACVKDPEAIAADPDNQYFLRRVPRRLEAEAVRDSVLAVSGRLDPTLYGPPVSAEETPRRSVYLRVKRSKLLNTMVSFDQPEPLVSQGIRPTTTVTPQALMLLNSRLVRDSATAFASRIRKLIGDNAPIAAQVAAGYRLALGREPEPDEQQMAVEFLSAESARSSGKTGLAEWCQVLLELNEFAYLP
jgi:mono/diheme cytochrome c family protein